MKFKAYNNQYQTSGPVAVGQQPNNTEKPVQKNKPAQPAGTFSVNPILPPINPDSIAGLDLKKTVDELKAEKLNFDEKSAAKFNRIDPSKHKEAESDYSLSDDEGVITDWDNSDYDSDSSEKLEQIIANLKILKAAKSDSENAAMDSSFTEFWDSDKDHHSKSDVSSNEELYSEVSSHEDLKSELSSHNDLHDSVSSFDSIDYLQFAKTGRENEKSGIGLPERKNKDAESATLPSAKPKKINKKKKNWKNTIRQEFSSEDAPKIIHWIAANKNYQDQNRQASGQQSLQYHALERRAINFVRNRRFTDALPKLEQALGYRVDSNSYSKKNSTESKEKIKESAAKHAHYFNRLEEVSNILKKKLGR